MGEYPEKYNFTLRAYVAGHARGGDSGGNCSTDGPNCGPPVMWRKGRGDRNGRDIPRSYDRFRGPHKVLVEASGARHMEPFHSDRLNPFAAHFMGCHVADLQKSCGMVYGDAPETMCSANRMTTCKVVAPYVSCGQFTMDACELYMRCSWNGTVCLEQARTMTTTTTTPFSGSRLHRECWTDGGCRDDGAGICNWCGTHDGSAMYCCRESWSDRYTEGHNCHGAIFSEDENSHTCVLPSTGNSTSTSTTTTPPSPTPAPIVGPTPLPTPAPTPASTPAPTSAPTPMPTPLPTPAPTVGPTTERTTTSTITTTAPYHYFAASTVETTCASEGGTPTTKDMCFHACNSGVGGANRYKVGRWRHSPGCFVVVSGRWQGGCHWNLDTSASAYYSRTRAICTTITTATTTTMLTTSAPTPMPTPLPTLAFEPLPASHRCMGQPPQGWANLGTGLTQGQCHDRCLPIQSCIFVTFWSASGACTSFEGCDSTVTQTWNKVSGLERRLRGAVQTWAKVLGEEDQGILI